jgi:primosomal protein N' (replication factor Y)
VPSEQLELLRTAVRRRRPAPPEGAAEHLPVARVAVDVLPAHLDRPFDYAVPASMADRAVPGVRVRVRFAGQDVDGFVLERAQVSDHVGPLAPLRRVVSPEPVLTPEVLRLARAVADRYAGTLGDVLRLAVPPRHAGAEKAAAPAGTQAPTSPPDGPGRAAGDGPGPWASYPAGPAFLARLEAGGAPRAVWTALPGPEWPRAVAVAVAAADAAGRGSLVVLPDRRDVDLVDAALTAELGPGRHVRLEADLGPAARYAAFLALARGRVRIVVGTRAAALAPVADLGLAVLWDDGDDQHAEPRAPYPHAREVLVLRAEQSAAALLLGGWSRTAEGAALVAGGWARSLEADRATRRRVWPRVVPAADGPQDRDPAARSARMPTIAWRAVHDALPRGPVLVQVPRRGYVPGTACGTCRRPARCPVCSGPVALSGSPGAAPTASSGAGGSGRPDLHAPSCGWCGRSLPAWACPHCGGRRLRATAVGVDRTAEELGRAFPGSTVVVSRPERTLPAVPAARALVLATPGVEPVARGGYAAAVLLDGDVLLSRQDLRAGEDALRRWACAAALVRPAPDGGLVVVAGDPAAPAVQALVRADPAGHAERELAERTELRLPPGAAVASLTGPPDAVRGLLAATHLPPGTDVLGPVPLEDAEGAVRTVVRAPEAEREPLTRALREAQAVRSARREPGAVRIRVDPRDLG